MSTRQTIMDQFEVERATLWEWFNPIRKPLRHKLGLLGLVGLFALPMVLTPSTALTISGAFFLGAFAMSWDAVSGYTGQISFGHGVFFVVGGYTSMMLNVAYHLSPFVTIPIGVIAAALAGLLIGAPTLRLRGPYFSLVTLIIPVILLRLFIVFGDVFHGNQGPSGSPDTLFGITAQVEQITMVYYLALVTFVAVMAVLLAVTRSDAGRVFTALRESEDAVSSAGLNPAKYKIYAFVLSAAVGGFVGAVFVHTPVGSATPKGLHLVFQDITIVILASILGGMGTIVGAAVGGIFFVLLQQFVGGLDFVVPVLGVPIADVQLAVFTTITVVLIYFLPGGILRGAIRAGRWVLAQTGRDVATDGGRPPANPVAQTLRKYRNDLRGGDDER
ncbi:MAG: branched-chain amino acid ABC transporter permease [Haloarculaceae archaeon]